MNFSQYDPIKYLCDFLGVEAPPPMAYPLFLYLAFRIYLMLRGSKLEKEVTGRVKELFYRDEWNTAIEKNTTDGRLFVADFYAEWCGPCKRIAPAFGRLSMIFTNCDFYRLDVDRMKGVSRDAGVSCMPTFQFYKGGKIVDKLEGASEDQVSPAPPPPPPTPAACQGGRRSTHRSSSTKLLCSLILPAVPSPSAPSSRP